MQNDLFVTRLEREMWDFRMKPSATVWQQVEKSIRKEKKRRMLFWWIFSSMIVFGGVSSVMISNYQETEAPTLRATGKNIATLKNNQVDIRENKNTFLETPINDKNNESTNSKIQIASNTIEKNKVLTSRQESSYLISPNYALQDRLKSGIKKATTDANNFITQNIKNRTKDTIIVVNCTDNTNALSTAKNESKVKERQLNFNAFYSFHGTGDLSGTKMEVGVEKRFGKRYGFFNNLGVTIHSGQEYGSNISNNPLRVNSTYNDLQTITVGLQTAPTFYRYSKRGDLKIGAGLVAR